MNNPSLDKSHYPLSPRIRFALKKIRTYIINFNRKPKRNLTPSILLFTSSEIVPKKIRKFIDNQLFHRKKKYRIPYKNPSYFFMFRQHDLQLLSFFTTNNSSRLWRRRQELESARKWTGAITFRSPREIPLSRLHRGTQQGRRGEGKLQRPLVSRHNRSRITTRGRGGGRTLLTAP